MNNYDSLVNEYSTYEQLSITDWECGLSVIFDSISPVKDKKILDYGCGTGRFSRFLHKQGGKLIGVDVSEKMIEQAKNFDPLDIQYHVIESAKLDFIENQSIDLITINYVTCTVPSQSEVVKIFESLNRVLKDTGNLVILDNNWEKSHGKEFVSHKLDLHENLKSGQKVGVTLKSSPEIRIEDHFWSKDDYTKMLNNAGFHVHSIQEPLAKDTKHKWIDEQNYPPSLIITARKISS